MISPNDYIHLELHHFKGTSQSSYLSYHSTISQQGPQYFSRPSTPGNTKNLDNAIVIIVDSDLPMLLRPAFPYFDRAPRSREDAKRVLASSNNSSITNGPGMQKKRGERSPRLKSPTLGRRRENGGVLLRQTWQVAPSWSPSRRETVPNLLRSSFSPREARQMRELWYTSAYHRGACLRYLW